MLHLLDLRVLRHKPPIMLPLVQRVPHTVPEISLPVYRGPAFNDESPHAHFSWSAHKKEATFAGPYVRDRRDASIQGRSFATFYGLGRMFRRGRLDGKVMMRLHMHSAGRRLAPKSSWRFSLLGADRLPCGRHSLPLLDLELQEDLSLIHPRNKMDRQGFHGVFLITWKRDLLCPRVLLRTFS